MTTTELKQAADKVFAQACAAIGRKEHSRAAARAAVIEAIKAQELTGTAAHFAGSYSMAGFGYGGGL
jgi:hypothetical protein